MREVAMQGQPIKLQVKLYVISVLREQKNVLRTQKKLEDEGYKLSYPYLLGLARKYNIKLKRGRPCNKN